MTRLTRRQMLGGSVGLFAGARALSNELGLQYVPGEMLVRLPYHAQGANLQSFFPSGTRMEPILSEPLKRLSAAAGQNLWRVSMPGDFSSAGALARERNEFASRSGLLSAMGFETFRNDVVVVPVEPLLEINDPLLPQQYYISAMGIDRLWRQGIVGTRDVPLIVIDTGVQSDHPDLFANFSLSERQGFYGLGLEDRVGHGTFVAGIGAAVANGIGGAGVAPGCRIVSLKALELMEVLGVEHVHGTEASLLSALYHILNNYDEAVVVMALGQYEPMPLVAEVIQAGVKQFLVVAATGNDASDQATRYPAAYARMHKNILSVTAVDRNGYLANFANNHRPTTDIAAYGVGIVSTYINASYATGSGTSFSAALIVGLMVLCWSSARALGFELSPEVLKRAVIQSGHVDSRQAQFDPIPALLDATRVWHRIISPTLPPRGRFPIL